MRLPEFTASASLGITLRHYRTQSHSPGASGLVPAQSPAGCFCSEPDLKKVCTSPGHCTLEKTCLQWFCPGRDQTADDDDFGERFGLSPQ